MKQINKFPMVIVFCLLSFMLKHANAMPFEYSLDRFEVIGNIDGYIVDEFNDGMIEPWGISRGTAAESSGLLTLANPGESETYQENDYIVTLEQSDVTNYFNADSSIRVVDGEGDFEATSMWVSGLPRLNQWFQMEVNIGKGENSHFEEVTLEIRNVDSSLAEIGEYTGLAVKFSYNYLEDFTVDQLFYITEEEANSNILLSLIFDDSSNLFTGGFSLDGGATYQSPFYPYQTHVDEGRFSGFGLTAYSMEIQAIPEPPTLLLILVGFAGLTAPLAARVLRGTPSCDY